MPPPLALSSDVELPLIVQAEIVRFSTVRIAPPLLPGSPPVSVKPLITTVLSAVELPSSTMKIRVPSPTAALGSNALIVSRLAPGPLIVRFLLIVSWPKGERLIVPVTEKSIVSSGAAAAIASRSDVPAPTPTPLISSTSVSTVTESKRRDSRGSNRNRRAEVNRRGDSIIQAQAHRNERVPSITAPLIGGQKKLWKSPSRFAMFVPASSHTFFENSSC